ncbi:MAG: NAD-dependent epimerase/dehydratase family protein [Candidatus Paceibacterota bacterium]|jgi:CDP-paratose 2-epimerase
MVKVALITGSAGLIGSESARFFAGKGYQIVGVDNNMRKYYFGEDAGTKWNRKQLTAQLGAQYQHYSVDIRDRAKIEKIVKKHSPNIVIHTAAQPSHDWAAKEPHTDFSVNALGTLVLLESVRQFAPHATFIFTSTNKVYGDQPNYLPLIEKDTRWEIDPKHAFHKGIDESMSIDQTLHSVFGASKVAADVMVQEYGKYFGLKTAVFRGGCLTGPNHSGAQLHGFLSYLVKCIATGTPYSIFGYKGKQVRDNIHAHDLVNMFWHFHKKPRSGEVYNAGGGRQSNISMLEAIAKIEKLTGKKANIVYKDTPRVGDHIWYISDLGKFKSHYPKWDITYDIDATLKDLCAHVRS